jgi:DNA-directed RNA polymerase specialized sigma24 family protein
VPSLDLTSAPMELREVADAADRQTRALVEGETSSDELRAQLVQAAGAAMAAGCSLADIAQAEDQGKAAAREALGSDLLRRVTRSARRLQEVEAEHKRSIVQAVELGLPFRDVGQAAGVSHGTIRAIVGRVRSDLELSGPDEETVVPDGRA